MATIHDVAHKAQVSIATVSRVINGTRFVDPATKERVLSAMRDLDYRPNFVARNLRRHSSRMIGLVVSDNSNPFYAEVARAIEDAGYAEGYSVILCNSDVSAEKQRNYVDILLSYQVDGLIILSGLNVLNVLERILSSRVPIVVANNEIEGLRVDEVVVDSLRGGCLAAEYLLRLGHRRIGYICGSQEEHRQARRTVGFCRTLEQAGVALHPQALVYGDTRYESGRRCMQELLRRDLDLTAVFVFDDLMALGALNWLLTNSYRVPEDMSLIGFDDILYSSAVVPALTTIAQPIAEIGAECMRLVLERIRDPERPPSRVMLPTQLIERSSCRSLHSSPGIFGK